MGDRDCVPLDHGAGRRQVVGGLERDRLDVGQGAADQAGERAGRGHLDNRRHAEVCHGAHAQVPADRVAYLGHDPLDHLATVVDDSAICIGQQAHARIRGRSRREHMPRAAAPLAPCARCGTRRPPGGGRTWRRRGGERGELLDGARCDDLAGTVDVGRGQAPAASIAVRTSSGSPPSTADMLVGWWAAAAAIARPRSRTRTSAGLRREDAGAGRRGQLPHTVPGSRADHGETVRGWGNRAEGAQQSGSDEQGLSDRGIADLVRHRPPCRSVPGRDR